MTIPGCLRRRPPIRFTAWLLLASIATCFANPPRPRVVSPGSGWSVTYPAANHGRPTRAAAVALADDSLLVSVTLPGADAGKPTLRYGNSIVPADLVGHDPVSRLSFLRVKGPAPETPATWLPEAGPSIGAPLTAATSSAAIKCRATGWAKQVGGKILPLALLRVTFDRGVPVSGTPLLDASGHVVAIVLQPSQQKLTAYAIPAEAVHRVFSDISSKGKLTRGWLGLTLRAENPSPQIVRVFANSPASNAGLQPSDVLQRVGSRPINDYADAANAFFYLAPGQPVKIAFLRGVEPMEASLTPTLPPQN